MLFSLVFIFALRRKIWHDAYREMEKRTSVKKRSRLLTCLLFWLARVLVSLRYDVTVKGKKNISSKGGILFLPNHPAEIDPILLMAYLGPKFFPRPMVVEHFYRLKGFQWILDLIGVMPIPTMEEKANIWRGKEVARIFKDVVDSMQSGDNFVIYPAGKLKSSGRETIGGASFVHSLLQACPEIQVVLVRTTGLWGSSFSRAHTGRSPNFGATLLGNFSKLLKNGIFFLPKRKVLIEIQQAPKDLPIASTRLIFNKYLEEWYNKYPEPGAEPLSLVSYSSWKEDFPPMTNALSSGDTLDEDREVIISFEIEKIIKKELSTLAKIDESKIHRKADLSSDLGLDSLDIANIHIFLDRKFDVIDLIPGDLQTVEDVLLAASGLKKRSEKRSIQNEKKFAWPKDPLRKRPRPPEGSTIPEAFLRTCDRMGSSNAAADSMSGVISYKKMKIAALALSGKIAEMPGDRIGIMLPSSVGAYITILAVLFSKKVPVMLNWTAGVRGLDHASDVSKLSSVLTSRLFLDRIELRALGKIETKMKYLEDIRHSITFFDKVKSLLISFKKAPALLKWLRIELAPSSSPAVILFTSGTESLPKAVPLSHENILFDQAAAISCVNFKRRDCLYGVLPPFHSFGFSITGLMPLLSGLKAYYAPDPNNSHGMAEDMKKAKPTIFCSAPSFIKALFSIADPVSLKSLRLVVAGAEKAPKEIADYIALNLPHTKYLEGYGITECSPVVTLCRMNEPLRGLGKPLPGIELCTVHPDTKERLPYGEEGEICIKGANVFSGYIGENTSSPFIEMNNERWYLSGDMGYLDEIGNLYLTDRLKRFMKVGGEMVSLGGLEEEILLFAKDKQLLCKEKTGSPLALCIKEKESEKPELVLFTTFSSSREEINAFLKDAGWGRIIKISEVRPIGEIPLTGVGKTDYRLLDEKYLSGNNA